MSEITVDRVIEAMEDLGFNHVDRLNFEDDYNDSEIDIDDIDFDISETCKSKYKVYLEDDNEIVVNIPDDELLSAKQVMNGSNPDTVDAHPLALLYIKGNSQTKSNIRKAVSDEKFWQQRHSVINNDQLFEYEEINIVLESSTN